MNKYLTFIRDRKTNKFITYQWQRTDKTIDEIKERISDWNSNPKNERIYELCESEEFIAVCKSSERSLSLESIYDAVKDLERTIENLSDDVRHLKEEISDLKEED